MKPSAPLLDPTTAAAPTADAAVPATPLTTTSTRNRPPMDRAAWVEAATDILAQQGVNGLRVEVIAKSSGMTKGSFYWHFKDRQDLLEAVLHLWRDGRIRDIDKQTSSRPGQELEQISHVIEVYSANRNRRGISIELAVRDWARRDATAAAVVEAVDCYRLECTRRLFVSLGLSETEAKARSVLLYAYVFGQSLMIYEHYDNNIAGIKQWIANQITTLPQGG